MAEFPFRVPRQSSFGGALVFWTAVQPDGKRPGEREDRNGERNARLEAAAWNAPAARASKKPPRRPDMALGTNYARNPSRKQQFRVYVGFAQLALRDGKTRDDFLAEFKPGMEKLLTDAYIEAERLSTLPAEQTFALVTTAVDPTFNRPESFRRTVKARDLKAARAKALGEFRSMVNRNWGDTVVEIMADDGTLLGAYIARGGKPVWTTP